MTKILKSYIWIGFISLSVICKSNVAVGCSPGISGQAQVCFTPGQSCLLLIQKALREAKREIHVQAYGFSQTKIVQELINATHRGVKVVVLLDKSQKTARYSQARYLTGTLIKVFFDEKPAIAHNKIIIVDGKTVITGSYNFTQAAEKKNAENLLVITSSKLAALYEENFQKRLKLSVQKEPRT